MEAWKGLTLIDQFITSKSESKSKEPRIIQSDLSAPELDRPNPDSGSNISPSSAGILQLRKGLSRLMDDLATQWEKLKMDSIRLWNAILIEEMVEKMRNGKIHSFNEATLCINANTKGRKK